MALCRHQYRQCIYSELEACISLGKDQVSTMREQVDRYRAAGYPHNNGLAETTLVLRRRCEAVARLERAWWAEICRGSCRDQLSFDYVCWRHNMCYDKLPWPTWHTPYFSWQAH